MTVDKIIRILENTKRIEKTETVEIDKVIEMLNDLKQNQINYKFHLKKLKERNEELYKKDQDITDFAKKLAFESAILFFESDIEEEW